MSVEVLVRVSAPYFCAGVIAIDNQVVRSAPILKYMMGWDGDRFSAYCEKRGWVWDVVGYPVDI